MTQPHLTTLVSVLIQEKQNDVNRTALPDVIIREVKTNIRKGAADLEQKWSNALELVHKAYEVANVTRPTPDQKGAWAQYELMIQYAVKQLVFTRGIDGEWRSSRCLFSEAEDSPKPIGKKRFFASVPGALDIELEADNLDGAIREMANSFKRHGYHLQIDTKDAETVELSVWANDVKRDTFIIRQI